MKVCKTLIRRFDSDPRLHHNPLHLAQTQAGYAQNEVLATDGSFRHLLASSGTGSRDKTGKPAEEPSSLKMLANAAQNRTLTDILRYSAMCGASSAGRSRVYFASAVGRIDPAIKIGVSSRIDERLYWLENFLRRELGAEVELELLASIPGTKDLEEYIHRAFHADRVWKEWFQPSADLLSLIEEIKTSDVTPEAAHA